MNKSKIINWLSIAITVSVSYFWYHMSSTGQDKSSINQQALKSAIDITITDISVKEFNQRGELVNFLETPKIVHIPQDNTHILTKPHIIIQEAEQEPWDINANLAKAIHGGKQITFSDDVNIKQCKTPSKGDILLSTEEITYFPNKKYAITQKDVKLKQNNSVVEATGLKAFLAESRIQFLKNTKGHYEQNNG